MTNGEKALFLIDAAGRLNNALAHFNSIDKCSARKDFKKAIRTVLAGTRAEKFTDELIAEHAQHHVPFHSNEFSTFTELVSASSNEDLFSVFVHYTNLKMLDI